MARSRKLNTGISQDERVAQLAEQFGDFAVLLYTWMIPHAEDNATLPGTPRELKAKLVPMWDSKTPKDVESAINGMVLLGLLEGWDRTENVVYFDISSFYKYQSVINEDKRRAAKYCNNIPLEATNSTEQQETARNSTSFSSSVLVPVLVSPLVSFPALPPEIPPSAASAEPDVKPSHDGNAVTRFQDAYKRKYGDRYLPANGDGKQLKDTLTASGPEVFDSALNSYFACTEPFIVGRKHSASLFYRDINRWASDGLALANAPPVLNGWEAEVDRHRKTHEKLFGKDAVI